MSSKNLVICDPEKSYASRLAAFLNGKRGLAFQVKICSDPEQVRAVQEELTVDFLLISDKYPIEQRKELAAEVTIVLLSEMCSTTDKNENSIFKYQSAEEVFSQIMRILSEKEKEDVLYVRKKGIGKMIGVFSPVHRTGQTVFALRMGKELAKKQNVLYLNLETYAGIDGHFPKTERNLSMLLYYAKQRMGNPGILLPSLIRQMERLDYIPPVSLPEEIKAVTEKEWLWLFSEILRTSIYEVLILDIGECVQGLYEILKSCDTVYLLTADDPIAASKLAQFEQVMYRLGYGEVWERMVPCDKGRTII